MAKPCQCLIPDEYSNCTACGKPIDLPEVDCPNLGDITGIIHLIDSTIKIYIGMIKDNLDPNNPTRPRLRMVGGRIMRIPHSIFCQDLLKPSYQEAKNLGYRGSFDRWQEIICEIFPLNPSKC